MFRLLIIIAILSALVYFNWDKLPPLLQTVLTDAKTVSAEVYDKGKGPIKEYVNKKIAPKANENKDSILK